MSIALRPYQREALRHLHRRLTHGHHRLYIEMPTGTGKSTIAAVFTAQRLAHGRVLALVHRQELAQQLVDTYRKAGLTVGVLMEGKRILDAPVVVATIQSLTTTVTQDLLAAHADPIQTVVIDEAHHAVRGSSYERIVTTLAAAAMAQPLVTVGMTATPYRTDARSMLDLLPVCAFSRTIPDMVREGWLAPLIWLPVQVELDLAHVATTTTESGEVDYADAILARHLLSDVITAQIVEHTVSQIGQRPTLVFAANVQHAHQLMTAFQARGYAAAAVSGHTSRKQRDDLFARWRSDTIQVICNCALLTEGFDYPEIAVVIIARPTLSLILYLQMIGRGMRTAPGKTDCLIIDAVGNQLDPSRQVVLPHVVGIATEPTEPLHPTMQGPGRNRKIDPLLRRILGGQEETELPLLDPLGRSEYRWTDSHRGYFATINATTVALLERDPEKSGLYRSHLYVKEPGVPMRHRWIDQHWKPLRQQVALVHQATRDAYHPLLAGKDAAWRSEPVSDRQLQTLGYYNTSLPAAAREAGWTKGDASNAITNYHLRNRENRR